MRTWMTILVCGMTCGCGWLAPWAGDDRAEPATTEPDVQPEPDVEPDPDETEQAGPVDSTRRSACDTAGAPASCTEQREWGSAVVLRDLYLEGRPDEPVCCTDVDGDGEIDNSFGLNLAGFQEDPPRFETAEERLASGADAVAIEVIERGADVELQWWPVRWQDGMDAIEPGMSVIVEPYAIDAGMKSRYGFDAPVMEDGRLVSRGGVIEVPIVVFGVPLRVEADMVEAELELEEVPAGYEVTGTMGVVAAVEDVYAAFNRRAEGCSCFGPLPDGLLRADGTCREVQASDCDTSCRQLADACNLTSAIGIFADIDRDGDGRNESISGGYWVDGVPGSIAGVAP